MPIWRTLARSADGAVAPTIALSILALAAVGGIAFDYARLASMDSELQNAADQAALAAASQLDQEADAVERATAAAQGLITNQTLMANDSHADGLAVKVPTVLFYATKDHAENGTNPITDDATAKFVRVSVRARKAVYALTPIVSAFRSDDVGAEAVAGLGSAICKVPPVMICNPDEPIGNANKNYPFDAAGLVGRGLKLVSVGNGSGGWAPGNFGYLDTGSSTSNPNVELREALGWTTAPGDCSGLDGVKTRTGAGTSVTPALNTRFDIYEKITGGGVADSCPAGANCPPSINTTKDLVRKAAPTDDKKCAPLKNNEWELPAKPYLPTDTVDLDATEVANVDAMGHPRDKCHAISINGSCTYNSVTPAKIGDGAWDRNAYFKVNYGWTSAQWPGHINSGSSPIPSSTPSRYQVYLWEIANRGTTIGGKVILAPNGRTYGSGGSGGTDFDQPKCSQLQGSPAPPGYGGGIVPGGTNVDRRRISGAVLNCKAWNVHGGGGTTYPVLKWVEYFLVEPSINRPNTDANDVYVEIIGETIEGGAGQTAGQVVRRDVPYLIK